MKTALITGASRGIGNAIASHLKNEGYRVLGTATSTKGVEKLEDQGIEGLVLDLNSFESKELLWEQVESKKIQISVLVNNAGITRDNIVLRMSENEWQDIMNVNLNGTFYLSKKALKMMLKLKLNKISVPQPIIVKSFPSFFQLFPHFQKRHGMYGNLDKIVMICDSQHF